MLRIAATEARDDP